MPSTERDTDDSVTVPGEPANTSPDSPTVKERKPWHFAAGYDPRRNLAGRPKKGATVLDLTLQQLHKQRRGEPTMAQFAAAAQIDRMMQSTPVGARAWADVVAYESGLPKQAFVVETQDAPGWTLMQRLAARGVLPQVVDGESRVLPASADGDTADG